MTTYQYRITGVVTSLFLLVSAASIYNILLLLGLSYTKSTLFGAISLFLFAQLISTNWLRLAKKYFLGKNYSVRMAIILANKKINIYSFELALMLLIPGAIFVFLLPASLRETGIVVILGAFIMIALWLLVSNFYFPSFISSIVSTNKKLLLPGRALTIQQASSLELDNEKPKKGLMQSIFGISSKTPINFYSTSTPILFIVGALGLFFWLYNYDLAFPKFFKSNKLLTISDSSKNLITEELKGLNGQFKELKNIPRQIAHKNPNTVNLLYYLFPETTDIQALIRKLTNQNTVPPKNNNYDNLNWTLQTTEAFSILPALKTLLKLIVWSTLPLSCYCAVRFNLASAISLSLSSFLMLGLNFLFMYITSLSTSNLFPEIILSSFLILLALWVQMLVRGKLFGFPANDEEKKNLFFKSQGYELKCLFHSESTYLLLLLAFCTGLVLFQSNSEIIHAILLLLAFSYFSYLFFVPLQCRLWAKFRYIFYSRAFKMAIFFINKRKYMGWRPEEENVLGINY